MNEPQAESVLSEIGKLVSGLIWLDGFKSGLIAGVLGMLVIYVVAQIVRDRRP